ncbi:3-oxoacyl-ACP reductase FabG [Tsukamurella ocularis]|uniref:3-oxoacyl-ACP reductase FabG n=1 Tax=Tsukamurella ocularis TaxID=1970234 RepID=UPI00216A52A0|nr:3-oxoacyl-ACP reductase FabG [Tsukamurella ocularis]
MRPVAVITGSSRGLGAALMVSFAQAGYDVAGCYRTHPAGTDRVRLAVEDTGARYLGEVCDIGDVKDVKRFFATVIDTLGAPSVVIANAGITEDTPIALMSDDQWQRVIDTNLTGSFYVMREAAAVMRRQRQGAIIAMSSVAGMRGQVGQANYAAAKSGLIAVTKTLSLEVARQGIRVNSILPGYIASDMTQAMPEKTRDRAMSSIPLRRFGKPEEVAGMALYLASDAAAYVTGQSFVIDGGLTA